MGEMTTKTMDSGILETTPLGSHDPRSKALHSFTTEHEAMDRTTLTRDLTNKAHKKEDLRNTSKAQTNGIEGNSTQPGFVFPTLIKMVKPSTMGIAPLNVDTNKK